MDAYHIGVLVLAALLEMLAQGVDHVEYLETTYGIVPPPAMVRIADLPGG